MSNYRYDADSDVDAQQMTHFDAHAELNAYAAENERLTQELDLRIRQLMQLSKDYAALLGTHEQTRAELAGAQDMATTATQAWRTVTAELDAHRRELSALRDERPRLLAANARLADEREAAHREADAQTLKANSFRGELHRYMQHAIELKDMLDISVAERDALRAELDNERNAHNATAAQLYAELAGAQDTVTSAAQAWRTVTDERDALRAELDTQAKRHAEIIDQWKAEENMWRYYDKKQLAQIDALRAELDAMRQAHSVIAARMEAMGC